MTALGGLALIQLTLARLILAIDEGRRLIRSSDLEHGVRVLLFGLALLAEVEVRTHTALVPDALDGLSLTPITSDSFMHLRSLVRSTFAQIVHHQSLESLSGVGGNLFLEHFEQVLVELVVESARAIASSARQPFPVDLSAVTSETHYAFLVSDLLLFLLRLENLAIHSL